jgi:hypothetical protein
MIWIYKQNKKPEWKKWFAWYPVPVGRYPIQDGDKIVWFEVVERKWLGSREGSNSYLYRLVEKLS